MSESATLGRAATVEVTMGSLPVGSLFAGRYEVVRWLGEGGMGAVYRVTDLELREDIALKLLRPEVAHAEGSIERFRREVKLARRVTHTNVARTYDLGTHEGTRFLTMELIEGEPLSRKIGRAMPIHESLRIVHEVARGLAAAHAVGVVHRDLKPDNVMISSAEQGRIVITDFGIARSTMSAGDVGNLTVGAMIGTPAYMSPEQVEGRELDGRSDVYSLGIVLFELLTGTSPFRGETLYALAAARLLGDPPDPRDRDATIPAPIAALVRETMARAREDRPDAQAFLRRVETLRGGRSDVVVQHPLRVARGPTLDDTFRRTLEAEIARSVSEVFKRHLHEVELETDPETRELLDSARLAYRKFDADSVKHSIELLRKAHARSPTDSWVMSALGRALLRLWLLGDARDRDLLAEAEELSVRALAADSTNGETFATIGIVRLQRGEMRAAARALQEAVARAPDLAEAHEYLGSLLCESAHAAEGLRHLEEAVRLDPALFGPRQEIARIAALTGDRPRAHKALLDGLEHTSDVRRASFTFGRLAMWWRDPAMLEELHWRAPGIPPERFAPFFRALGLDTSPRPERDEFHELAAKGEPGSRWRKYFLQLSTEYLAAIDEFDRAFSSLQAASDGALYDVIWLDACPLLAPMRSDPRFARVRAVVATRAAEIWDG